jgi:hypothetical protein
MILRQHHTTDRRELSTILEWRWPDVRITDPIDVPPSSELTGPDAAALARRRRGIEPRRVVVFRYMIAGATIAARHASDGAPPTEQSHPEQAVAYTARPMPSAARGRDETPARAPAGTGILTKYRIIAQVSAGM